MPAQLGLALEDWTHKVIHGVHRGGQFRRAAALRCSSMAWGELENYIDMGPDMDKYSMICHYIKT